MVSFDVGRISILHFKNKKIMQNDFPYTGTYEVGGKILELTWNIHKEAGQDLVLIGFDKYKNRYIGTAKKEGNGIKNVRFIKN